MPQKLPRSSQELPKSPQEPPLKNSEGAPKELPRITQKTVWCFCCFLIVCLPFFAPAASLSISRFFFFRSLSLSLPLSFSAKGPPQRLLQVRSKHFCKGLERS
jgi:hypothetical protein